MISHQPLKDPSDAGVDLEGSHRSGSRRSLRTTSSGGSGRPRSVNAVLDLRNVLVGRDLLHDPVEDHR